MSWVRVDDKFPRHPKVCALPAAAVALWLSACCWASEYETDGRLPAAVVERLPWYSARGVAALEGAGLWEALEGGGWRVHDFTIYNPSAQQRQAQREGSAARMQRSRTTKRCADVAPQHSNGCRAVAAPPSPSPAPSPEEENPPIPPAKRKRAVRPAAVLPEWMPAELWADWLAHKRALRAPVTEQAERMQLESLARWREQGHDALHVVRLAIERGWRGFVDPNGQGAPRGRAPTPRLGDDVARQLFDEGTER